MKKITAFSPKIFLLIPLFFAGYISFAQTPADTVKPGNANDPMIVQPGKPNDDMTVKPAVPNDEMATMTDTGFLRKNIMDNMQEIELSKLGKEKGTAAQVKRVAGLMIADHTEILKDLRKIAGAADAKKPALPKLMDMPPNKNFDSEWASKMLTMHEEKIVELEKYSSLTTNKILKAVADKALTKIRTHVDLLKKIPGVKSEATKTI